MFASHRVGLIVLAIFAAVTGLGRSARGAEGEYKLLTEIHIGGGGGWDYLAADAAGRRLYVTHGTKIVVIDLDQNKVVGEIADTPGVHGFAIAAELGRGFSSNGQENKSSIVELGTLKTIEKVATGSKPDWIMYEPKSGEVWTCNGKGASATAFDAKSGKVIAQDIPLGGKPETGAADGQANRIYINLEDKSQIAAVDIKEHKVVAAWPIDPGSEPTGLAYDAALHRLIIGCGNAKMVMMDSTNGKVVASVDCGEGVDAAAFDPQTHLAFVSAGKSGVVTLAKVEADKLTVVQTLVTEKGARTMAVDLKTHRIYLANAKSRNDAESFKVLVYELSEAAKP